MSVHFEIPAYVAAVRAPLLAAGFHVYLVGGCVRDLLRGTPPHDYDLTTDATPDEMKKVFSDFRVIPTGLAHGTLTVLSEGHPVEITTHRTEGAYSDGRRPDSVAFTHSLTLDLSRRDFTVNAMAFAPDTGLTDPFGGQEDLKKRIIRTVGAPAERFREDALRILRAFRFAATLDFDIEKETANACAGCAAALTHVSVERIFAEYEKLICAPAAMRGLRALAKAGCQSAIFGALSPVIPPDGMTFSLLPVNAALRTAALLPDATDRELAELCRRLHTSRAFSQDLVGLSAAGQEPLPQTPFEARRFVCRHFPFYENALALIAYRRNTDNREALALCRRVHRNGTAVELRRLAVTGLELQQEAGIAPRDTAQVLAQLQEWVWEDPKRNKRPLLLEAARKRKETPDEYARKRTLHF